MFMKLYLTELPELYREIELLSDPLVGVSDRIDVERSRSILADLLSNYTERVESLIMIKYCWWNSIASTVLKPF